MTGENDRQEARESSKAIRTRVWHDVFSKIEVDLHAAAATYIYGMYAGQSTNEILTSAAVTMLITQVLKSLTEEEDEELRKFFDPLRFEGGTAQAEKIYCHLFNDIKVARETGGFWGEASALYTAAGLEGLLPKQNQY